MATVDQTATTSAANIARSGPYVSVIVPVFNERESIPGLHAELTEVLASHWEDAYELIFIDDGSTDGSSELLEEFIPSDPAVVVVHFRRNFGQTAAMTAGFATARGEVVVSIDADLQNDPADIPALVSRLEEGYDVDSGWRKDRQDNALTRTLPSRCANWLIGKLTGVTLHDYGCTLKAYRRQVVADIRLYGEMHRFIPVYVHMQGGAITEMPVHHRARSFGQSKYGLGRIYKVFLDLLLVKFLASYASKPIYVFGGFGLLCLAGAVLPVGLAIFFKFTTLPGWQKDFVETPLPVLAAVLTLVGMLAILQGLLAEMLMRTYYESQGKRPYVLKKASPSQDLEETSPLERSRDE